MNVCALELELSSSPDHDAGLYLINSLREGFLTGLKSFPDNPLICDNLQSAKANPEAVSIVIADEVRKGYLLGPFTSPPFLNYRISPVGVVEKKHSTKKRLIVDLSAPPP